MKQLTVLMVEDSAPDAELILREIRRGGYAPIFERVDHAAALQEALTARSWDIILADYSLPRFSAPEAFAVLRAVGLDIPFIIVSGTIGEETAVDAMRLGVQDYILKHKLTRLVPAIERELIEAARRAEHRRMRRDLERAEQMLARSERLRTLGQMASGISHDLKNVVISPTSLQVQIAERALRCGNKEMAVEALAAIRAILKDGLMTIECLSDFCRYPSLKPSVAPIDLNQVVHRAVGMAQARVQPGQGPSLRFVKELGEIPAVQASATEVLSAVVNLLVNAIDAMPDGGRIIVRTFLQGEHVCLAVVDEGTGISPELERQVFESFFTTKGERGTGIGLMMVAACMQRHGGSVQLKTTPGHGSIFTLCFAGQQDRPSLAIEADCWASQVRPSYDA